jgi:hypothetical protein
MPMSVPERPIGSIFDASLGRFGSVLDLPGVVEGVPRDPVGGVSDRPLAVG